MKKLSYEFENYNGLQLIIASYPPIEFNQLNQFELNMLKENTFDSLLQCEVEVIDNEYKFHYNVHGLKKLHYHMQVDCSTQLDLYQMMVSLLDALKTTYANMLMPDGCILHKDSIFYEEVSRKIYIAYLPLQHKESIQTSLMQWFLQWTNQVVIVDYNHLFMIVSTLMSTDFTLEQLQEMLFSYIYMNQSPITPSISSHANQVERTQNNMVERNQASFDHKQTHIKEQNIKIETPPLPKFDLISSLAERTVEHEVPPKPNSLRFILLIIMGIALIAALWTQLYLPSKTTQSLLIALGLTLSIIAISVIVFLRYIDSRKIAAQNFIVDQTTDEHYPPYHYVRQLQQVEAASQSADVTSGINIKNFPNDLSLVNIAKTPPLESKKVKPILSSRTVKLDEQHATELIGSTKRSLMLCRTIHNETVEFPLTDEEFIVGRSQEGVSFNEVYSGVSRLHIQFQQSNGLVLMRDLGSRNGSYLNGQLIAPYKNYYITETDNIQLVDKSGPIYSIKWL